MKNPELIKKYISYGKGLANLAKRKYTNTADNTYREHKATIICKKTETQLSENKLSV